MPRKPYFQQLSKFPAYYRRLFEYVRKEGRFTIELLSNTELQTERLRMYRYISSMQHFAPDDPLTPLLSEIEIRSHNYVLEVSLRTKVTRNIELALDKAEAGDYTTSASIDPVADANAALEESLAKDRLKYPD